MGLVSISNEWDMGVASVALSNGSKQFSPLQNTRTVNCSHLYDTPTWLYAQDHMKNCHIPQYGWRILCFSLFSAVYSFQYT